MKKDYIREKKKGKIVEFKEILSYPSLQSILKKIERYFKNILRNTFNFFQDASQIRVRLDPLNSISLSFAKRIKNKKNHKLINKKD